MDVEAARKDLTPPPTRGGKVMHRLLVALNCGMLALGTTAGPLLTRLYYDKGGQREWLSACLQSVGWPLLLIPVAASYAAHRARDPRGAPVLLTPPRVLLAAAGLGVATGADNYIYAYSLRYLPVSTSAILISTQLAFAVFFAFLIVRQRLTPATVNAVALLTVGAAVLGLHVSSDRPAGVARGKYLLGFALALGAAALYGLILPLVELAYKRAAAGGGRAVTYALVMEMQLVMGFFATAFCTVGMIVDKDSQCNKLPNVVDADVIGAFLSGTTCESMVHKLGHKGPRTTKELLDITTSHASDEEVVGAIFDCLKGNAKQDEDASEESVPQPRRYPLVVNPIIGTKRLTKVLMNGGSGLNIMYVETLNAMGIDRAHVRPTEAPFHDIVPRKQDMPLGQIDLPITFGDPSNYRMETLTFEVVVFHGTYHAILGRP
ncbi:purine permease 3-like [Miscanthus floridulus]|uniref:purine permease 3-like n=1 Tax=Miscanthus floridulus TaxID=154761 RepID=UPI003457C6E7